MRAVTYNQYGPPEVLHLSDVEPPEPAADDVLIRVRAAEVTKSDCEMRSFQYAVKWFWLPLRLVFGLRRPKRQILGGYFSGEIAAVGKHVVQFKPGDAVYGSAQLRLGAYAEFMTLPANYTIVAKPDNMSFTEAAAVPLGGLNALHFMRLAEVSAGEQVLINGAGGSIGAHAIQIAKAMQAEVTAVDAGAKESFIRRLGADHFIDYQRQQFTDTERRYDVVFDMVPGSDYGACIRLLKPRGRYLSGNPKLSTMLRTMFTRRFTDKQAIFAFAKETHEELLTLKHMIEQGHIQTIVERTVSMQEIQLAHKLVETEQRLGAIVLQIDP